MACSDLDLGAGGTARANAHQVGPHLPGFPAACFCPARCARARVPAVASRRTNLKPRPLGFAKGGVAGTLLRAHEQALNISRSRAPSRHFDTDVACEDDGDDLDDDGSTPAKVPASTTSSTLCCRRVPNCAAPQNSCVFANDSVRPGPCSLPQYMCANAPDKADARSPMVVARESLRAIVRTRSA